MFALGIWAARWAALKAIGWSGVGRWAATRAGGALTGSWAWAIVVVGILVGGLVLWHWLAPPPRTYTAAEVRADRQQRIIDAMMRANTDKDDIIAERARAAIEAEDRARGLEDENRILRERASAAGGVAFTDDDPWMREKRRRSAGGGGKAGAR